MSPRPRLTSRERLRLFELHGRTCHICKGEIDPVHEAWDIEHVTPKWAGGDDSDDNRRPAHRVKCHPVKTALEATLRAKGERARARFLGALAPSPRSLPCGRRSPFKRKLPSRERPWGGVVERGR